MAKRLSVILGEADQRLLEPFLTAGTGPHLALQRWAEIRGARSVSSDAAAIRALLQAGAEALSDDVLDAGYAELARVYHRPEEREERRASRDRYVARTAVDL